MKVVDRSIGAILGLIGALMLLDGFRVIHLSRLYGGRRWIVGGAAFFILGIVLLTRRGGKRAS